MPTGIDLCGFRQLVSDLFDRNVTVLRGLGMGAAVDRALSAGAGPLERQDGDAETPPNLLHRGAPVFAPDAATYAQQRLAAFRQQPNRVYAEVEAISPAKTEIAALAMQRVVASVANKTLKPVPDPDAGYMLVVGLGLGLALADLAADYPVATMIVLEDKPEFLFHSLHLVDYGAIAATLEARGGTLKLYCDDRPVALAETLLRDLRGPQFPCLDGFYLFEHHGTPVLNDMLNRFRAMMPVVTGNDGFFEDEVLMLENAIGNMIRHDCHLLIDEPDRPLKDMPVFVVGSGPSLNGAIEHIRRNRDNVILITAGTGLGPILAAGMKPDFHTEAENPEGIITIIDQMASLYDLSGITLIAANTVQPDVAAAFDRRIFYWREVVVPFRLMGRARDMLAFAGPTVTNLAVRAALSMGFFEYYLFGVDLGSREPDRHHATGSIYDTEDDEYWKSGAEMDPLTIEVEGNLGNTVYTNRPFLLTKIYFDKLFSSFPACHFFNASDGVKFEGITPIIAETLVAGAPPCPPEEMVARCVRELPLYKAGHYPGLARLPAYRDALAAWCATLKKIAEDERTGTIQGLIRAVIPHLAPGSFKAETTIDSAAAGLATGSVISLLQTGYTLYRRLPSDEKQPFLSDFCDALIFMIDHVAATGLAQADRLIASIPADAGTPA